MRISTFCFLCAGLAALSGMSLGIYMGLSGDFTLAPAHAHLNLLGWVTMAVYALYHRGVERARARLAWVQAGCGAAGFPLMAGGLGVLLATANPVFVPVVIAGALLALTSMALFLAVVVTDAAWAALPDPLGAERRVFGW